MEDHIEHCLFWQICTKQHHLLAFMLPSTYKAHMHTYIYRIHMYYTHIHLFIHSYYKRYSALYTRLHVHLCVIMQLYSVRSELKNIGSEIFPYITINLLQYSVRK